MTTKDTPTILCIAGGSGSGKSTLAEGLAAKFGEKVSVLGLDDYQHAKENVPLTASGRRNYDHPTAVDRRRFAADLAELKAGREIKVQLRRKTASMEDGVQPDGVRIVQPAPLVIVEGYLALHFEDARALYDTSIFLRLDEAMRVARRRWVKDEQYVNEVLLPMHRYFVEPSAEHAACVIEVGELSPEEVLDTAMVLLEHLAII